MSRDNLDKGMSQRPKPRPYKPLNTLEQDLCSGHYKQPVIRNGPNIYGPVCPPRNAYTERREESATTYLNASEQGFFKPKYILKQKPYCPPALLPGAITTRKATETFCTRVSLGNDQKRNARQFRNQGAYSHHGHPASDYMMIVKEGPDGTVIMPMRSLFQLNQIKSWDDEEKSINAFNNNEMRVSIQTSGRHDLIDFESNIQSILPSETIAQGKNTRKRHSKQKRMLTRRSRNLLFHQTPSVNAQSESSSNYSVHRLNRKGNSTNQRKLPCAASSQKCSSLTPIQENVPSTSNNKSSKLISPELTNHPRNARHFSKATHLNSDQRNPKILHLKDIHSKRDVEILTNSLSDLHKLHYTRTLAFIQNPKNALYLRYLCPVPTIRNRDYTQLHYLEESSSETSAYCVKSPTKLNSKSFTLLVSKVQSKEQVSLISKLRNLRETQSAPTLIYNNPTPLPDLRKTASFENEKNLKPCSTNQMELAHSNDSTASSKSFRKSEYHWKPHESCASSFPDIILDDEGALKITNVTNSQDDNLETIFDIHTTPSISCLSTYEDALEEVTSYDELYFSLDGDSSHHSEN